VPRPVSLVVGKLPRSPVKMLFPVFVKPLPVRTTNPQALCRSTVRMPPAVSVALGVFVYVFIGDTEAVRVSVIVNVPVGITEAVALALGVFVAV